MKEWKNPKRPHLFLGMTEYGRRSAWERGYWYVELAWGTYGWKPWDFN